MGHLITICSWYTDQSSCICLHSAISSLFIGLEDILIWWQQSAFFLLWIDTTSSGLSILLLQWCKILWHASARKLQTELSAWSGVCCEKLLVTWVMNSLPFMEVKGSVLCSQVLVLSSHLWLGLPSELFPSDLDQHFVSISHFSHASHLPHLPYSCWFANPNNILWIVIVQFSPSSCHLPRWGPKYIFSSAPYS